MKCILHIGTAKTATTLLQQWLYDNEANLSKNGIALTKSARFPNNRKLAAYCQDSFDTFFRSVGVKNAKERDDFFYGFEAEFLSEITEKSKTHDTFIFTSEHFHSRLNSREEIQSLKILLDKIFSEYQIICYFREQSNVRKSLYSTSLKVGYHKRIEDFQNDVELGNSFYNYQKFFKRWEDVFGKENLRPRLFEKEHLTEGDIRKDFLATVVPQVDVGGLNFQVVSANESLSRSTAKFYRVINAMRPQSLGRALDPTPSFFKSIVSNAGYFDTKEPIYDPRQADLYDVFNSSNIEFFDRYFGEKRNLFHRPISTPPPQKPEVSLGEDDIVDLFSRILEKENLVTIHKNEINFLRDLALRLYDSEQMSASEAIVLLKIANRARPNAKYIRSKIEELSNKI